MTNYKTNTESTNNNNSSSSRAAATTNVCKHDLLSMF